MAWRSQSLSAPSLWRDTSGCVVVCAVKRKPLIKRRRPPTRKKPKNFDAPIKLHVTPAEPEFVGRMTTEINSVFGPRKLAKIVGDYGPALLTSHLSQAISILAGLALGKTSLSAEAMEAYRGPARQCAALIKQRVNECDPLSCARTAFGLSKLGLYDKDLFDQLVQHAQGKLMLFQPESLAGLIAGLAATNHTPPRDWLDRYCLEAYAALPRFTPQELANMVWALGRLQHRPSDVWLEAALRRFRAGYGSSCTAPSMIKFIHGVVKLQYRPDFNWLCQYLAEARNKIDLLNARELSTLMWACAQLDHQPDLIFMECWYKAAARLMPSFNATSLALAMHALGALQQRPVPGKFINVAFPRLLELMPRLTGADLASLIWGLVQLRLKPNETWMQGFLSACGNQLSSCEEADLADVMWSLASLRYLPDENFMGMLYVELDKRLEQLDPKTIALAVWAVKQLGFEPRPDWEERLQ